MNAQVSVEVLNEITKDELEKLIEKHLTEGYKIQDSQIQWYLGKIQGVYVFVKGVESEGDE